MPVCTDGTVRNAEGEFERGHMLWCPCGAIRAVFENGVSYWVEPWARSALATGVSTGAGVRS